MSGYGLQLHEDTKLPKWENANLGIGLQFFTCSTIRTSTYPPRHHESFLRHGSGHCEPADQHFGFVLGWRRFSSVDPSEGSVHLLTSDSRFSRGRERHPKGVPTFGSPFFFDDWEMESRSGKYSEVWNKVNEDYCARIEMSNWQGPFYQLASGSGCDSKPRALNARRRNPGCEIHGALDL